jgi:hypothetical protein
LSPTPIDNHDADYWASQLRLGGWIAVGVAALGMVRVATVWPAGDRWWPA